MRLKAKEVHHAKVEEAHRAKVITKLGLESCVKTAKAKEACHATATGNGMAGDKALVCPLISHLELEAGAAEQVAGQALLKVEVAEQVLVEAEAAKEAVEAVLEHTQLKAEAAT